MMVIYNAIYINKTNNQLSFQNIEHKKSHMTFEIQVLALTRHTGLFDPNTDVSEPDNFFKLW